MNLQELEESLSKALGGNGLHDKLAISYEAQGLCGWGQDEQVDEDMSLRHASRERTFSPLHTCMHT